VPLVEARNSGVRAGRAPFTQAGRVALPALDKNLVLAPTLVPHLQSVLSLAMMYITCQASKSPIGELQAIFTSADGSQRARVDNLRNGWRS